MEGQVVTSSNFETLSLTMESKSEEFSPRYDAGVGLWSELGVFNLSEVTFVA